MMLSILILLGGFLFLIKGADWLVDGASAIAERAGVSQLIVGLTLVSFGTSVPELFINFISRLSGEDSMTVGNIIGSSIANILLILGVSSAVYPLALKKSTVSWEIPYAAVVASVLWLAIFFGGIQSQRAFELSRIEGLILLGFFLAFLCYVFALRKKGGNFLSSTGQVIPTARKAIFLIVLGLVGLAFGANGVVHGGVQLAVFLKVPESVIALSMVAIGSTLPEMMASVMAVLRKKSDIAVGNIVGSNIFNVSWILGLSAVVSPLPIEGRYLVDAGVLTGVSLLLFLVVFFNKKSVLSRLNGIFFIFLYGVYMTILIAKA